MNENINGFSNNELLSLQIDSLKNNGALRKILYAKLLKNLFNGNAITDNDIQGADVLIKTIANAIDWDQVTYYNKNRHGEDSFFNGDQGLYTGLINLLTGVSHNYDLEDYSDDNLLKTWNDHWNESLSDLLKLLATGVDPRGTYGYENRGLLIELTTPEEEGMIDTERLWGSIGAKGAAAKLRMIDIRKADAGANFVDDTEVHEFYRYYEHLTIKKDNHTHDGKGVMYCSAAIPVLDKISTEEGADLTYEEMEILYENTKSGIDSDGPASHRFSIGFPDSLEDTCHCTLTGEFTTFKVVSKPWVIPWYNIDGESYRRVRGDDKKLSVLCDEERLGFTKTKEGKWIRLIMPTHKRKVEVEDLNRNFWVIGQVLAGISITLFDEDGPINKMLQGILKEIGELWENMAYLWAAMALISQPRYYNEIHTEVVMLNQDIYRQNLRYDEVHFGTVTNDRISERLNYLIDMYPNYNLVILPYIRRENYEHNYFSKATFPGVWIYNRNDASPQWQIKKFYDDDENYLGSLVIDLEDYINKIYGVLENEETYTYVTPLSNSTVVSTQTGGRFYGLARDNISLTAEMEEHDDIQDIHVNLDIKFNDVGQLLIRSNSRVIYRYQGETNTNDNNRDIYADIYNTNPSSLTMETNEVPISKGFYQGELLSCYSSSSMLKYAIKFVYVELPPEYNKINSDDHTTFVIRDNPTNPSAYKYGQANKILSVYFHSEIEGTKAYNPECIYIMIGHFYYGNSDYGDENKEALIYYDLNANETEVVQKTTAPDSHQLYRGGQGVDTGLVIIMPQALGQEITFPNQATSMWDYSNYVTYPTGGRDPRSGGAGIFGGNSAYRIDLFLDNNTETIQGDNWIIKYTTIASVSSNSRKPDGTGNQGYVDSAYLGHTFAHDWNKYDGADYDNDYWANKYNINERIYVHYIASSRDGNNNLVYTLGTHKLEREDLDGDFNNFNTNFDSTITGTIPSSSVMAQYNANVQEGIKIQDRNKDQILRANGCVPSIREKDKKDWVYSDYPDYENYPNSGYSQQQWNQ